ncbi:MAG TPA: transglutaminase family protein [Paracoccaceae bacterium]|nr:transglutaminase family protein [Paracoccaceae bacterium]
MRLSVSHRTIHSYTPEADRAALRLKLFPQRHAGQAVLDWRVSVNGCEVRPLVEDAFGNAVGLWQGFTPEAEIAVLAEGMVETTDTAGVVRDLGVRPPEGVFLRATPLTQAGEAVVALAEALGEADPLARLHALSGEVAEAVAHRSTATDPGLTAEQALERGAGSCKDLAHVFIAAARHLGLPARHVVGYVLSEDDEEPVRGICAWAEAVVPGLGWVGFDLVAGLCPTERYVRLGCGLDARDAAPIHANVMGMPEVTREAEVRIAQAVQSQEQ